MEAIRPVHIKPLDWIEVRQWERLLRSRYGAQYPSTPEARAIRTMDLLWKEIDAMAEQQAGEDV